MLLLPNGCEFAFGALVYMMMKDGFRAKYFIFAMICLAGSFYEVLSFAEGFHHGGTLNAGDVSFVLVFWSALVVLFLGVVFGNQALFSKMPDRVRLIMRQMGLMTYPLYLLHQLIGSAIMYGLYHAGCSEEWALGVTCVFVLGLTYGAFRAEMMIRPAFKANVHRFVDFGAGCYLAIFARKRSSSMS